LLSPEITKCRGPTDGFMSATDGVLEASRPRLASNVNWKISSVPRVGTKANRLLASTRIEWALRPTGMTWSGSGATFPSVPTAFTLIRWAP
jgi:hypothetical protein